MAKEEKAPESSQVLRARRKLVKLMEAEKLQINDKAIEKAHRTMRKWLSRHADERIDLKSKTIRLFDDNQHSESTHSRFVLKLIKNLAPPAQEEES